MPPSRDCVDVTASSIDLSGLLEKAASQSKSDNLVHQRNT